MSNSAYKHLESPLKIAEMTLLQWAGILVGIVLAGVWAADISPFGGSLTIVSTVYIAGVPALLAYLAVSFDVRIGMYLSCFVRWRRSELRYAAGPGASDLHYRITERDIAEHKYQAPLAPLDAVALWDD